MARRRRWARHTARSDTTITDSQYGPLGQPLANVGTVIALEKGPDTDEFFLTFDVLGTHQNVRLDPVPLAPAPPADVQRPRTSGCACSTS